MIQRVDRRTLRLQLLPMSVPHTPPVGQPTLATWGALPDQEPPPLPGLNLCPGETAELLVRLDYRGEQSITYQLQVSGDFPPTWYAIHTEGNELQQNHPIEAVVRFRPDPDYFEARSSLSPGETLILDYQGEVRVYRLNTSQQAGDLLVREPFRLILRPRSLYPQFLPAVYRDVDFIGRFLKIFEQSFEPAVQTLETLWAYLDPLTAPETLLAFLARWVGWQNEANWTIAQQRSLLRRAMEIYRWRGTRRGLQLYLHLYTGLPLVAANRPPQQQPIQIDTATRQGFVLGEADLGETALLGGGKPLHFRVRLCPTAGYGVDEALVRSIIEQEKPAVCTYDLEILPVEEATYA